MSKSKYPGLHVSKHPVTAVKIAQLRDENTTSKQFRELLQEISNLLAYEATSDLSVKDGPQLSSPLASYTSCVLTDRIAIVPVLRSGLGMVDAMLSLIPTANILHLGLFREKTTLSPVEYYNKLPHSPNVDLCIVLDPIIATGGTAVESVRILKDWGIDGKHIKYVCICASQQGIARLMEAHNDIQTYVGVIDDVLDQHGYILPGLGDCGDRLYDTMF
jgi:uracil phosphoribosyltransferase